MEINVPPKLYLYVRSGHVVRISVCSRSRNVNGSLEN